MSRKWLIRALFVFITLFSLSSITQGQGGPLSYGDIVNDVLNPGSPIIYTFTGTAGDVATVYVLGSADLQATLSVSNSSGIPIGFSTDDPLTPMPGDVRITAQLPETDTYIVTLNNTGDAAGNYTLSLSSTAAITPIALTNRTTVVIDPEGSAQQFTIAGTNIAQVISIQSLRPSLSFYAQLFNPDGNIMAVVSGGLEGVTFVAPANDGMYTLIIAAADASVGAEVEVAILAGGAPPSEDTGTSTGDTSTTDPNACVITSAVGGGVNVRSGPGTNYNVIGALVDDDQFIATGQNSGWYTGNYNGQAAWVAANVVNATGACGNLPFVEAPAPSPATTEEASATQAATATDDATETEEATETETEDATEEATETEEATQVAFTVTSLSCRWLQNDGATVDFSVEGPPDATFQIDVRQGSTTYSATRTLNSQGFLTGNHRFGQAGNDNYTAYIVYNGVDVDSAEC